MEILGDALVQFLAVFLSVATAYLIKKLTEYLNTRVTKEEREDILFWTGIAVQVAEEIYKGKGQGALKKDDVIKFLQNNGFKISETQMDVLIDAVVAEFNKNGWDKPLIP